VFAPEPASPGVATVEVMPDDGRIRPSALGSATGRSRRVRTTEKGVPEMMVGGVILLSFLTGLGVAIFGLIVVIISVVVVGLAMRPQP